jgi:hypothetical protein
MKKFLVVATILMMFAAVANAEHGGPPPMGNLAGGPGHDGGWPEGRGGAIVGSDGTIYLTRANATTANAVDLVAVLSTGTVAWTTTLPTGAGRVELSGTNLIAASRTKATDGTITSTLTAISTTSGAPAWTSSFTGDANVVGSFSGGTYVMVVTPAATSGGTPTRSLQAVGNDGKVLWSVSI